MHTELHLEMPPAALNDKQALLWPFGHDDEMPVPNKEEPQSAEK